MDLSILPECYVDTNLIETLVPPIIRGYNHQMGCGTVGKKMQVNFSDSFALGIIDKDKKQLDYLKEFTEVKKSGPLTLHRHKSKHHYIIQISPAIEQFILDAVASIGLSMEDFGLPAEINALTKVTKTEQSKNAVKFKDLFKAIKKAGNADFLRLAQWVKYLRDNPYDARIEDLE